MGARGGRRAQEGTGGRRRGRLRPGHLKDSAGLHFADLIDEWGPVHPQGGLESSITAITSTGRKGQQFPLKRFRALKKNPKATVFPAFF